MTQAIFAPTPDRTACGGHFERLSVLLGQSVDTDLALVGMVSAGVSPGVIDNLVRSGLTRKELDFVINPRTLTHRLARHESLTREESERAVRVASLLALAEQVFGDRHLATDWMRKPLRRFDEQSPLEISRTEQGARLAETALIQIDEGYFA